MERRTPTAVRRGRKVREKAAAATAGEGVAAVATGLDRRRPRESRYDTAKHHKHTCVSFPATCFAGAQAEYGHRSRPSDVEAPRYSICSGHVKRLN